MLWKICKPFLGETTTKKTFLESDNTSDELTNNFHPSQLEEKFGGTAPNVEGPYWPPVFPQSGEYDHDPECIVSEEEYK